MEIGSENLKLFMELGLGQHGCSHYRRRCKIRAPCCNEVFDCRHCHDEAKNALEINPLDRHDLPRHEVKMVICSLCETEQEVQQWCTNCGVCMGKYFCSKCKFFDDDVLKKQYHCEGCGICRTGGAEYFFHCNKCGCCLTKNIKSKHVCREQLCHQDCPVCCEFLFNSLKGIVLLRCGHCIHEECLAKMEKQVWPRCPVCLKSYCDMSLVWKMLDMEVAVTLMPLNYENKMARILCNDCEEASETYYHVVGLKCPKCSSYNTRRTHGGIFSCSATSADAE